jgi:NAD(P)-dependent dehydrogenase (short-subunit alcohol dehydrogenase family)
MGVTMSESQARDRFEVDGRVALITGGGGLMGREHALALLEIGARVVLADIDEAALARVAADIAAVHGADRVMTRTMDVTSERSIIEAKAAIEAAFGPVDILVNNAAIDPKVETGSDVLERSRLEQFSREQWDLEIAVGLTGAYQCAKVFGADMAGRGGGAILNVASDLSVFAPDQRLYRKEGLPEDRQPVKPVTYSVIKTGLIGLTRYLAGYWAGQGVRANAISPGGIYNGQPDEFVSRLTSLIPLGRMAEKNEYRCAVQFLCSDASRYMTGQNIVIDGGRSIL